MNSDVLGLARGTSKQELAAQAANLVLYFKNIIYIYINEK